MRLFLTILGTAWVTAVVVAYVAFGLALPGEGQSVWWPAGWVLAAAVGAAPFVLYGAQDG